MSQAPGVSDVLTSDANRAMTSPDSPASSHPISAVSARGTESWSQIWSQPGPAADLLPCLPSAIPSTCRRPAAWPLVGSPRRTRRRPSHARPTGGHVVALREVDGMARPHPGDLPARRGHDLWRYALHLHSSLTIVELAALDWL